MANYTYILSDFPNNEYDSDTLSEEIVASSISSTLEKIDGNPGGCDIYFLTDLSGPDQTTLDTVVANHQGIADPGPVVVVDLNVDGSLAAVDQSVDQLRVNGKLYAEWMKFMHSASRAVVVRIDDIDPIAGTNLGGMVILNPAGGESYESGNATEYWIGVDSSGITRAGFDGDFKPVTMTYGTEYQLQSALAETTSTDNNPVTKTTLTTTDLPSGTYKITVGWIGRGSVPNQDIEFDVTLNGTPQGTNATMNIEPKDAQSHNPYMRVFYLSLSGVNDIALRYWSENTNIVYISDATIELIRVE